MDSTSVTNNITLKIGGSWVIYNHLEIIRRFSWIIINRDGHILTRNFIDKSSHLRENLKLAGPCHGS